jgi:hypothetical protein
MDGDDDIAILVVQRSPVYVYAILYGPDHEIPKTSRKARSLVVFLIVPGLTA